MLPRVLITALVAAQAFAAEEFGLITIYSGSAIQNSGVVVSGSDLVIDGSSSDYFEGSIQSDGTIKLDDGKYVTVGTDGSLGVGSTGASSFEITDYGLYYNGKGLHVCSGSSSGVYTIIADAVTTATCDGYISPIFEAVSSDGQALSSGGVASASGNSTSTSSSPAVQTLENGAGSVAATVSTVGLLASLMLLL